MDRRFHSLHAPCKHPYLPGPLHERGAVDAAFDHTFELKRFLSGWQVSAAYKYVHTATQMLGCPSPHCQMSSHSGPSASSATASSGLASTSRPTDDPTAVDQSELGFFWNTRIPIAIKTIASNSAAFRYACSEFEESEDDVSLIATETRYSELRRLRDLMQIQAESLAVIARRLETLSGGSSQENKDIWLVKLFTTDV